jgi:outer membrane receptor protein involved in Fe transport
MTQRVRFVAALVGVLALVAAGLGAQVNSGTPVGSVRDANGVVPGASVTIREVSRGTGITPGQANENLSGASTFNAVIIAPSVEQVREFKVLSGVFSAEFGRGAGAGVVSVATKSGSNLPHGTVFEYLRNDAFDARNFFVRKVAGADGSLIRDPKPALDRHQFGVAVGGPLVHNRTFFFADYAYRRPGGQENSFAQKTNNLLIS